MLVRSETKHKKQNMKQADIILTMQAMSKAQNICKTNGVTLSNKETLEHIDKCLKWLPDNPGFTMEDYFQILATDIKHPW